MHGDVRSRTANERGVFIIEIARLLNVIQFREN